MATAARWLAMSLLSGALAVAFEDATPDDARAGGSDGDTHGAA